jgi:hypothetical protein
MINQDQYARALAYAEKTGTQLKAQPLGFGDDGTV